MMRRRYWPYLFVTGLFMHFTWVWYEETKSTEAPEKSYNKERILETKDSRPAEKSSLPVLLITLNEMRDLRKSFPEQQDVRLEVRENPHQTPDSLIKFAQTLAPLVEKAKENPEDAKVLIDELGDCVSKDTLIVSARALCLSKVEQLVKTYPQFKNTLFEIREKAGPDLIELHKKKRSLIKKAR